MEFVIIMVSIIISNYHVQADCCYPSDSVPGMCEREYYNGKWYRVCCCRDCSPVRKAYFMIFPFDECGVGPCNIFGCNCDGGCRMGDLKCTRKGLQCKSAEKVTAAPQPPPILPPKPPTPPPRPPVKPMPRPAMKPATTSKRPRLADLYIRTTRPYHIYQG